MNDTIEPHVQKLNSGFISEIILLSKSKMESMETMETDVQERKIIPETTEYLASLSSAATSVASASSAVKNEIKLIEKESMLVASEVKNEIKFIENKAFSVCETIKKYSGLLFGNCPCKRRSFCASIPLTKAEARVLTSKLQQEPASPELQQELASPELQK